MKSNKVTAKIDNDGHRVKADYHGLDIIIETMNGQSALTLKVSVRSRDKGFKITKKKDEFGRIMLGFPTGLTTPETQRR